MLPSASALTKDGGTSPDDLVLVRRALQGDPAAVEGVLARLSCIVRFVFRLNRALGYNLEVDRLEDVVQQVYAAVWPRLAAYSGSAALESWVYGFCRNCLRAERRRVAGSRALPLAGDEPAPWARHAEAAPAESALLAEGVDALLDELHRLRASEREVVVLRHLEGWSFEQIARHKELPASTVKDRCYRALIKLRERLKRRDVCA